MVDTSSPSSRFIVSSTIAVSPAKLERSTALIIRAAGSIFTAFRSRAIEASTSSSFDGISPESIFGSPVRDQDVVLDAHADALVLLERRADRRDELLVLGRLGQFVERIRTDVDSRLHRDHHARLQLGSAGIVHIQSDPVADPVIEPDAHLLRCW